MEKVIGITGGIASGKSSISSYIRDVLGFPVIDADIAAREAVKPGQKAYTAVAEAFGKDILLPDGQLDRPKLGAIVFGSEEKRLLLNSIVHPAVREWMASQKEAAFSEGHQTVFLDIPLLFESKLTYMTDAVILVYVDEDVQKDRLMKRNGYTEAEALARINSQMPLSDKKALADAVVDNNGALEESYRQLEEIMRSWSVLA